MAHATDTNVNFIDGPKDQRPLITGNKYLILSPGNTFELKEDIIKKVLQQISGRTVQAVEVCDSILVFCFIVSRAGTDIDAAQNELNALSENKPAVFIVLHHTFDPEKIVPDSSRIVSRVNTLTVDCLFHEDEGLLKCRKNVEALTRIHQWLQPQVSSSSAKKDKVEISTSNESNLFLLGMSVPEKTAVEDVIFGRQGSCYDAPPAPLKKITVDTGVVDGEQVTVINTADWFSSELSLEKMKQKIQFCIRLSSYEPYTFLLVIPGMQFIADKNIVERTVKEFKSIFEESWEKVIILFTVEDEQQKQDFLDHNRQTKLRYQFHVLNISEIGDRSQVSELLKRVKKVKKPVKGNGGCTLS